MTSKTNDLYDQNGYTHGGRTYFANFSNGPKPKSSPRESTFGVRPPKIHQTSLSYNNWHNDGWFENNEFNHHYLYKNKKNYYPIIHYNDSNIGYILESDILSNLYVISPTLTSCIDVVKKKDNILENGSVEKCKSWCDASLYENGTSVITSLFNEKNENCGCIFKTNKKICP